MVLGRLGSSTRLVELATELCGAPTLPGAEGGRVAAVARAAAQLLFIGRYELADSLLSGIDPGGAAGGALGPALLARIHQARAFLAIFAGDPGECLRRTEIATVDFERAGDLRNACVQRVNAGNVCLQLGAYAEGERLLREALASAGRMGLRNVELYANVTLGIACARRGDRSAGRAIQERAIEAAERACEPRIAGAARTYLAEILTDAGDLERAAREAEVAVETLAVSPPMQTYALAAQARARLASGSKEGALASARSAMTLLESLGSIEEGESLVRLSFAEALLASGDERAGRAALAAARERLLARAVQIRDPGWRQSFLTNVPENARTMALARKRLGQSP